MKVFIASLGLGVLALLAIYAINWLPQWPALINIQELLLAPGAVASSIFWPEGVHSDGGKYWILLSIFGNLIFYSVLSLILVSSIRYLIGRKGSPGPISR